MIEAGSKIDPTLSNLSEEQAKVLLNGIWLCFIFFIFTAYFNQSTCLLRRAILLCLENDILSVGVIAKRLSIESNIAKGLLNRLVDEGALKDIRGRK